MGPDQNTQENGHDSIHQDPAPAPERTHVERQHQRDYAIHQQEASEQQRQCQQTAGRMHEQVNASDDINQTEEGFQNCPAATVGTESIDELRRPVEDSRPAHYQNDQDAKFTGSKDCDEAQDDHQHAQRDRPARSSLDNTNNYFSHNSSIGRRQRTAGVRDAVSASVSSFKFRVSSSREFLRVVITSEARDLLLGAFLKSRFLAPKNRACVMTI